MRGLSSLLILRAILLKIDGKKPPEPHEVFDLAGGTSTGGLANSVLKS
jgi:patatin-like phospholipase/acyl hydrolase